MQSANGTVCTACRNKIKVAISSIYLLDITNSKEMLSWLKKRLQGSNKPAQTEQVLSATESAEEVEQITTDEGNGASLEETPLPIEASTLRNSTEEEPIQVHDTLQEPVIVQPVPDKIPQHAILLEGYIHPPATLLNEPATETSIDLDELELSKTRLANTLSSFGAGIQSISATVGPTDTLYEVIPAIGVRIAKIVNLKEDIALTLNAPGINITAPIPGKGTVGISIPNRVRQTVYMRSLIETTLFNANSMSLPVALGKRTDNTDYIVDLAALPHLLVAGATGQGKSVGINAIILSLLYKKHPSELKFVMIDTKQVELVVYEAIERHFLAKLPSGTDAIVTDATKAINTLNSLCLEMDNRYDLLKAAGVRNIKDYYHKLNDPQLDCKQGHRHLPYIVLIVDEFADLITRSGREVETPLTRLAQIGRAVGIHMIVSTQHPSSEVITSNIKANFLGRIAFKVTSKINSRTILDVSGAETLLGNGDMLISVNNELQRAQCAFVSSSEVEKVVAYIASQQGYPTAFLLPESEIDDWRSASIDLHNRDKMFDDCARLVVQMQSGSTSNVQRRFNLGYNRAGRIMDQLEAAGIVGPAFGSKPREVHFKTEAELERFLKALE